MRINNIPGLRRAYRIIWADEDWLKEDVLCRGHRDKRYDQKD